MNIRLIAVAVAAASIGGCATAPAPQPDKAIAQQLEKSIERVAEEPAFTATADGKAPAVPAGPTVSIVFHGDAGNLLKRIAAARGLGFKAVGPMPRREIFVSVDLKDASFTDFLGEVGGQLGQLADVALTDAGIELRYRDHRAGAAPGAEFTAPRREARAGQAREGESLSATR